MPDDPADPFDDFSSLDEDRAGPEEPVHERRKSGKGCGWKVAIIGLLGILVLVVICCGGGRWWLVTNLQTTSNVEKIHAWTAEILSIDIPENYTPIEATRIPVFSAVTVTTAYYRGPDATQLHLVAMTGWIAQDAQAPDQLRPSLHSFLYQSGHRIQEQTVKIREFKINGDSVDFHLVTGNDVRTGERWTELRGVVPTNNGVVLVAFQAPTKSFDEEAATKIIKTIGMAEE